MLRPSASSSAPRGWCGCRFASVEALAHTRTGKKRVRIANFMGYPVRDYLQIPSHELAHQQPHPNAVEVHEMRLQLVVRQSSQPVPLAASEQSQLATAAAWVSCAVVGPSPSNVEIFRNRAASAPKAASAGGWNFREKL